MASDRAPETSPPLSDARAGGSIERYKEAAARAGAGLILDGMRVGLGTGTTVAYLLTALGERAGELRGARFAATSPATARRARELGLTVAELDELGALDVAIDGADQVDPGCWLIKGGGGAHTREKIVATSAERFVVIVSAEKLVARLGPPVPLEVLRFAAGHTLAAVGQARLRVPGEHGVGASAEHGVGDRTAVSSPDGNLLAWYEGPVDDPGAQAERLSGTPGVVEHGLFEPQMVSEVLIAGPGGLERRAGRKPGG